PVASMEWRLAEILVVLAAAKVGQYLAIAPSLGAGLRPVIVVAGMASEVDHPIDESGAAEAAAPGVGNTTFVQLFLRRGLKAPVQLRGALCHDDGPRDVHVTTAARAAGLDQTNGVTRVLG